LTFDRSDHPKNVPHLGRYSLVVDPIMLMDGYSGLNIMYAKMLDAMGIDQMCIQPTRAPFHNIVLGKQAKPIR
jgi:hypothetical protein